MISRTVGLVLGCATALALTSPAEAHRRGDGGFFFGFNTGPAYRYYSPPPVYYPRPYYVPPPVYYSPPAYYAPPAYYPPPPVYYYNGPGVYYRQGGW